MKQKRKVKSLIPQKKFTSKSLKTAGLVFLGSALYLASITLLSTSVAFGANEGAQAQDFKEFDWTSPISDKSEVVYAARFATIDNLNNRIIDIFMNKDGVLYITPNPVIVNELLNENTINHQRNYVENGVYGHILGGDNNKVYSNNVTIIAGEENKVNTGSDNATMLGGEKNTINQGNGVPSAIIGGSKNTIETGHEGSNIIIGGYKNTIKEGVSGSAILGGESNTIESNTANAIIGGSNVINDQKNVFAYSNENNFKPENSNSFFLNMKKGVGINMEASGALNGLYVSGAVSLGDIDINKPCKDNNENYGLEGKYKGCLVGCTKDGWKMFDRGKKCETICKNNINIFKECPRDAAIPDSPDDYTAFCTGLANTDNATQCPELQAQMQNYKNVVFETKLVDNGDCPESEDKCIFQCDPGFHLTGLITNGYNSSYQYKKCYEDCYYPWDTYKTGPQVPTNTIITGYDMESVACSNVNAKHDNCGKHKQTLICYNNKRYNYDKENKKIDSKENTGHKYEKCTTTEYTCTSYALNKDTILTTLNDTATENGRKTEDRSTTTLTRGKYELCLDYDPQSDHDLECLERDKDNNPHNEHYKFVGCNEPEYYEFTGEDGTMRCMKSCTFDTNSGQIRVKHNESTGLYLSDNTTCPDPCKKQTFRCDDGTWKNTDGADINDYKYTSCNLNSQVHDGYNISENDFIRNKNNFTTYDHINISVKDGDIFSCKEEIRYKITGCADGYHLSSTLKFCTREATRGECGGLPDNYERTSQDQEPFHDGLLGDIDRSKGSTRGKNFRIGTWDNRQYEPDRDKCTKDCIEGYEKRNGQCVKDGECDLYNINQCSDGATPTYQSSENGNYYWGCPGDGGEDASCYSCADGYEYYDGECKAIFDGQCNNQPTNESWHGLTRSLISYKYELCKPGIDYRFSDITKDNEIIGYTWGCQGQGSNTSTMDGCHKCEPGYTWDDNEKDCVEGNGDNGECTGDECEGTTEDEDGICNNKIKYGCNEGHTATGKSETKYSEKTIRYCDGLGNGKKSGECFICKDGFSLIGDRCEQNQSNLKCGTASGQVYTNSGDIKGNAACISGTINGKVETSSDGNKFMRTCKSNNDEVSCSAIRVACGSAEGTPISDKPTTNLCSPNDTYKTQDVRRNGSFWEWRCGSFNNQIRCEAPKSTFSCTGELPGNNTRKSETEPTSNTGWRYTSNTSATLAACEWTCVSGYQRSGNKCVEKQCGTTGLPSPMNGVLTGKSTYVGTDDNRQWTYTDNSNPGACQWTCRPDYEKSGNGCIRTVQASCGNPAEHFKCKGGGTATNQQTGRDGSTPSGWTWKCQGTPGGSSQDCIECNTALGYEDTLHNGTCVNDTCPAPTITKIEGKNVYFNSNGGDYNSISIGFSETNEGNWQVNIGTNIGVPSSPRGFTPPYDHGYIKVRAICNNGVGASDSSNAMEFDYSPVCSVAKLDTVSVSECKVSYYSTQFNEGGYDVEVSINGGAWQSVGKSNSNKKLNTFKLSDYTAVNEGTESVTVSAGTLKLRRTKTIGGKTCQSESNEVSFGTQVCGLGVCGIKPTVHKYRGTTPNYTSAMYNGYEYWFNYDCQCNVGTKKWICERQLGSFWYGGTLNSYNSMIQGYEYNRPTSNITEYSSAGNVYNGDATVNVGTCRQSVYDWYLSQDGNRTIGTTNYFIGSVDGATACALECNLADGGTCDKSCFMAFNCTQLTPWNSYGGQTYKCGPQIVIDCKSDEK